MTSTNGRTQTQAQSLGALPYPGGVMRWLLHVPVTLYRMGLGALLDRMRLLVLATWGRRSGLPRYTTVEYRAHGSKVYIVAAWGSQTQWYRNLKAQPVVRICQGWGSYSARATDVTDPGEALRVLNLFRKTAPARYDPLLAQMSQRDTVNARSLGDVADKLTIVRFDAEANLPAPPPLRVDLIWVWPLFFAALLLPLLLVRRKGRDA